MARVSPGLSRRRLLGATASLVVTGAVGTGSRSSHAAQRRVRNPAHFLLVHGSWHGAWCWYKIVAGLEAAGHAVTTLDLPSAGIDGTPARPVTLQAQAERVIALLDTLAEPVILVGHSAGGPVVSTVAEARPDRIAKLVYLTAFLLPDGKSVASVIADDPDSLVPSSVTILPDGTSQIRDEAARELFYGLSDDADVALARALLKPVGLQPSLNRVALGAGFARVRRFYVACRRDRAITYGFQQAMVAALPCERVFTINADHSPFFSRPAALLRALGAIARS
jgi:pimeloyl-ACP methyl ester carboxylesterase